MNLQSQLPQYNHILAIAERVLKKYKSVDGKCQFMSEDLVKSMKAAGFRSTHVMGIFRLDEPAAERWWGDGEDEEECDPYEVNHNWVTFEGKIIDISAKQFSQYVHKKIPNIVFIGYNDELSNHYKEISDVE